MASPTWPKSSTSMTNGLRITTSLAWQIPRPPHKGDPPNLGHRCFRRSTLSPGRGHPAVPRPPPCSGLPHTSLSRPAPQCPDPGRGLWHRPSGCRGTFDAVLIVGALSDGQVPCSVIPELLRVTKPGGLVCLTTRTNSSNLQYKEALEATLDRLEQAGAWERLVALPVDRWELATSELEVVPGTSAKDGFISGIVYLYRKQKVTQAEEVRSSPQPPAVP
ncbi:methyltransferase-like protein 27 isoform X3 [Aotus nancymaae]|uniref:methyltransferase-like protein 27 isoform X3 n=1 Tax=Aotus nancymaae TaxID=37293 RepID=UPI0030FE4A07